MSKAVPYPSSVLQEYGPQKTFSGDHLLQIALPLGGIGAGCICLNGQGGLQDFSIRHQPATSALPDGHAPTDAAFAVLHIQETQITRLVEGPFPVEKIYDQGLKTQGYRGGGHEGLPRFRNCTFQGEYPFGQVNLSDPDIPLSVKLRGFNPFIPLDVKDSAIPCAILEYTLENTSETLVHYQFSYHLSHLAPGAGEWDHAVSRSAAIPGKGVFFWNEEDASSAISGSASLSVIGHQPAIKAEWFRGSWFDSISALWKELSAGQFKTGQGSSASSGAGRSGGSILLEGGLKPGEAITYPILITWYFPNVTYSRGRVEKEPCTCGKNSCNTTLWRPYYAAHWQDAREVALYVHENYADLKRRTQTFHDALFRSTLPGYVLDAVSANLAIIKSPTVLLQEDGNLWGWEGCFCDKGCCPGSCTHVWNYAQSIPHLFPSLERTLREQELTQSMDDQGHINFRGALPSGPTSHTFQAASDGQLGGIMKVYREWQISGDRAWLSGLYPLVKRSIDYCIETWDPRRRGVLEEPHHNTYDIEFWGPDGMCTSFYLGALKAMACMSASLGHEDEAAGYENLAQKGVQYLDEHLFNGEYFEQKVEFEGLNDRSFHDFLASLSQNATEEELLLKQEGPKYQYGSGCISDGVIGAWLAELCGFQSPQTPQHVRKNLASIFQYNFKENLWKHANLQRPGYALGDEPGLLLCTWPHGGKPTLPFVYSDEVWTGIEYQVASHLILNGLVDEGLTLVKGLRSRHDGRTRNPWNEYECGGYYARAMASYALLQACSGFFYSAVTRTLKLAPKLARQPFEIFFSTASGWGTVVIENLKVEVQMCEGELAVDRIELTLDEKIHRKSVDQVARVGANLLIGF
jgi:uncharacterized protein (DUF608 family)